MNEQDLLRYGEILTDDMYEDNSMLEDGIEWFARIRTISYNNHIYYHKMVNGEIVKVKELK